MKMFLLLKYDVHMMIILESEHHNYGDHWKVINRGPCEYLTVIKCREEIKKHTTDRNMKLENIEKTESTIAPLRRKIDKILEEHPEYDI